MAKNQSRFKRKIHLIKSKGNDTSPPMALVREGNRSFLQRSEMKRIKLNQESEEVGNTYKVIAISLTVGLNIIIFTWFFLFSGLTK